MARKPFGKKLSVLLIFFAIIIIFLGVYISYITNSKRIMGTALTKIVETWSEYLFNNDYDINIQDNYQIENTITTHLEREETSEDFIFLPNIKDLKTTITFQQDKTNKQMLFILNSNTSNKNLINYKFLVKNSTKYYYNPSNNIYINSGNSNYFEALNSSTNEEKNLNYILKKISSSLQNSINDNTITKNKEVTKQDEKNINSQVVKISLNNEELITLIDKVLMSLKEDETSYKIITGIYPDFEQFESIKDLNILDKNETLILKIYVDPISYSIKKYSLSIDGSIPNYEFVYEYGSNQDIGYIIKDTRILYKILFTKESSNKKIIIYNSYDNEVGTATFTKKKNSNELDFSLITENYRVTFSISRNLSNINIQKSYNSDINIKLKVSKNDLIVINFTLNIISEISSNPIINEDTSNSLLINTLTEEEKENLKLNLIKKLQESE